MFNYLVPFIQIVDGRIVSGGNIEMTWETKIRSLNDFNVFEKAVLEKIKYAVKVSSPSLLDESNFNYLVPFIVNVDGIVVAQGNFEMTWETKLSTPDDFNVFEKAVLEIIKHTVKISPPILLDC